MEDIKKKYKTVMDDHFPATMQITFGDRLCIIKSDHGKSRFLRNLIEKGLRYGENPGQEAALYDWSLGNLTLGDCRFIEPAKGW